MFKYLVEIINFILVYNLCHSVWKVSNTIFPNNFVYVCYISVSVLSRWFKTYIARLKFFHLVVQNYYFHRCHGQFCGVSMYIGMVFGLVNWDLQNFQLVYDDWRHLSGCFVFSFNCFIDVQPFPVPI